MSTLQIVIGEGINENRSDKRRTSRPVVHVKPIIGSGLSRFHVSGISTCTGTGYREKNNESSR